MIVTVYAFASNKEEAINIYREITSHIEGIDFNEKFLNVKPYWKINGIYKIKTDIRFKSDNSDNEIEYFLHGMANKWEFFGEPPYDAIASKKCIGTIMNDCIEMIHVFFN